MATTLADLQLGAPIDDRGRSEPTATRVERVEARDERPTREEGSQNERAHLYPELTLSATPPAPVEHLPTPVPSPKTPAPSPLLHVHVAPSKPQEHDVIVKSALPSPPPTPNGHPAVIAGTDAIEPLSAHAQAQEDEKKRAEQRYLDEVEPVGTIVDGIEDDQLWASLRQFDSQVTHVLSPPHGLPKGEPDLRRSQLPTIPPDSSLIRSNLERRYQTAGVGGIRCLGEMRRLMSWRPEETRRSAMFALAYFVAWLFQQTTPLLLYLLVVLITVPSSRHYLFPPIPPPPGVPLSATDPTNAKGDESMVSSSHPYSHRTKAEQDEQQSWEFVKALEGFAVKVLLGGGEHKPSALQNKMAREKKERVVRFGHTEVNEVVEKEEESMLVPGKISASGMANRAMVGQGERNRVLREGGSAEEAQEAEGKAADAKRDAIVGLYAKMMQDALGDTADLLGVVGNVLKPPAQYPSTNARVELGIVVGIIGLLAAVIPSHIIAHASSAAFGLAFFAQPLIHRAAKAFVRLVPNWQQVLNPRNSLFHNVPTQAQHTLHLLRLHERSHTPLPRPPPPATSPVAAKVLDDTSPLTGAAAVQAAATTSSVGKGTEGHLVGDGPLADSEDGTKNPDSFKGKMKHRGKKLKNDWAEKIAKGKVDILSTGGTPKKSVKERLSEYLLSKRDLEDRGDEGIWPGRLGEKNGWIVLGVDERDAGEARVEFVPKKGKGKGKGGEEGEKEPLRSFKLSEVVELKKGGVGLPRSVLGWAAGKELGGTALEIRLKRATTYSQGYTNKRFPGMPPIDNVFFEDETDEGVLGEVIQFDRIGRRDALFVRLLSAGPQEWETL